MDEIGYLQDWYQRQCDGDWEHDNGVRITTLDNPGWSVSVRIEETELAGKTFLPVDIERSEHDWIYCSIQDGKFVGSGGPANLRELLSTFLKWAEEKGK